MNIFNQLSVKWKIYIIAIISIFGFGGYLGFNVWVNSNNAKLLEGLRSVSFPVLEKANANRVRLDRLSELLNSAVLTGEADYIATAEVSAKLVSKTFEDILILLPDKKQEIEEINTSFNAYFNAAKKIATEMSEGTADMSVIGDAVAKKEADLTDFTKRLDAFIDASHKTFSANIDSANTNSKNLLTSGFFIWVVNILILTTTVYAIARIILTNINDVSESLHEIARGGGDFSKKITVASTDEIGNLATSFNELMDNLRIKTNDLMSMMQNMHQGLFTITAQETIHQEYSAYIESIFETKNVAGRNFAELLFGNASLGSDTLNQINATVSSLLGSDEMMFDFNSYLLIKEYTIANKQGDVTTTKILELDWDPIISDGVIHKMMVTVRDVTELKALQLAAEEQKKELQIIGQILKASPDKFDNFYSSSIDLLNKNESIILKNKTKDVKVVSNLFVNMHTIKGNARTFDFSFITNPVHDAENTYDRLRKEEDYAWDAALLIAELEVVKEAINQYHLIKSNKLTFAEKEASVGGSFIRIAKHVFDDLLASFETLYKESGKGDIERLHSQVKLLDALPFSAVIAELLQSLSSISQQLNKEPPLVFMEMNGLAIRSQYVNIINDVFTHLLRNSIDHGIETSAERVALNKPPQGTISITANIQADQAILLLQDDGKGLNLRRLKEKAIAANQLTEIDAQNPQKIADCLFLSGVSTAEHVTAISGRGVGMDAVRQYLQQNGCNIQLILASEITAADQYAPFHLRIELARAVYEQSVLS